MIDVGDVWPLQLTVRNAAGYLADATVALSIIAPDLTVTFATPTRLSLGIYVYDHVLTMAGRWRATFSASGTVTGVETLTVLVGLPDVIDAKRHLQIPVANTTDDNELQRFLNTAVEQIEYRVGALTPAVRTWTTTLAGEAKVWLPEKPVVSVQAITMGGNPITGWAVNGNAIEFTVATFGTVIVLYTVGRSVVPDSLQMAVLQHVREAWQKSQLGAVGVRSAAGDVPYGPVRTGWETLLEPYTAGPAVA